MNVQLCIVALLLFRAQLLSAPINRVHFQQLSDGEQFTYADAYLTKHWFDFYDSIQRPAKRPAMLAEYNFMKAEAKGPRAATLMRVFWCRNQQFVDLYVRKQAQGVIDSLVSIRTYAHQHNLLAEEGICWLAWCKVIIEHPGKMDERTRRILVYDGAIRGMSLLQNLPLSVIHQYHGATYDIIHHIWWMSMYFFKIQEYDLARRVAALGNQWAHPQLDTKEGHPYGYNYYKWQFLNDLGSCHLRLGKLKEAAYWYQKAYTFGLSYGSSVHSSVSYGNLGVVLSRQGKHAAAIPYLKKAIEAVRRGNDRQSEFNAMVPLSEIYLKLKQYDKAYPALLRSMALYDSVRAFVDQTDSLDIIPLFTGLGEVYQHRGDLQKALYYTQLANRLEEKQRKNDDASIFHQKQEKLEAEAYRSKLNQIDADRDYAVWLRNASITGLVLVLLISSVYLSYQRKRRREAEQQLAFITQEARTRTEQLAQLQQLREATAKSATDENLPHIAELMELAILTEADWERFRELFEQVYPNYLLRLRQKYTLLTPAETRIICLSRLALSTREMADMLGISADTIVKTRYRIRKKTNLPEGADLGEAFADV
ncbi:hypothetical protein DYU11_15480 [Fibrisoma montanum]|uniref:HTH luxR-type domain-containing protein n=2 Tax=Fibrisoma montanum TaxID=2305895 RepID=A0A418M8J0_9BACT|nr:hypothetical protein DYU11_15480 [Fibrisoma montanum]